MYDSHLEFESFFESEAPDGVNVAHEWQFWDPEGQNAQKWQRRFRQWEEFNKIGQFNFTRKMHGVCSKAYIIEPKKLYQWHVDQFKNSHFMDDYVKEITPDGPSHIEKTQKGAQIKADAIVICTGYLAQNFSGLVDDEKVKDYLKRSKPVRGTYLGTEFDLGPQSFSYALESKHLIYLSLIHI